MKTLMIFMITLTGLIFGAVLASANDLWSETPDLENLKVPSFIGESSRLSNKPQTVDMWAETPTLDSSNSSVGVSNEKVVVKSGLANPELYAETPDSAKELPSRMHRRLPDDVMIADQNRGRMDKL